MTFDHKVQYLFDVVQLYLNASFPEDENEKELDEIQSRINGVNVTIVHGDIRATFDFSVRDECYHTNCSGHNYDKKQLWTTIKATGQPSSVPFPINKKI